MYGVCECVSRMRVCVCGSSPPKLRMELEQSRWVCGGVCVYVCVCVCVRVVCGVCVCEREIERELPSQIAHGARAEPVGVCVSCVCVVCVCRVYVCVNVFFFRLCV